jgi:hypothetical protein
MITYHRIKNAPLTSEEIDNNFQSLDDRLAQLEEGTFTPEKLDRVEISGQKLTLYGSLGSVLGTAQLPHIAWIPKGTWKPETKYAEGTVVQKDQGLFLCTSSHTSTHEFTKENWVCVFDGTSSTSYIPQQEQEKTAPSLPLLTEETMPSSEELGFLGMRVDKKKPQIFFYDGQKWRFLLDKNIDELGKE